MFKGLLAIGFIAIATPSLAAFQAEQTVSLKMGAAKQDISFSWKVGSKGFRLDVKRNQSLVSYIFNGRNLYACSKLSAERLKELESFESISQKKIKRGVCQAVPANFMARFFLSPQSAILNLDLSDGMNYSLGFGKYDYKPSKAKSIGEITCQPGRRNYVILRKEKEKTGSHEVVDEEICFVAKNSWRKSLWRQMRRQLIRQPSAKALVKGLANDEKLINGFIYSGEGSFEKRNESGSLRKGRYQLSTQKFEVKKINPKEFRNPVGYAVIDIRQLAMEAKVESGKNSQKTGKDSDQKIPRILLYMLGGFRF